MSQNNDYDPTQPQQPAQPSLTPGLQVNPQTAADTQAQTNTWTANTGANPPYAQSTPLFTSPTEESHKASWVSKLSTGPFFALVAGIALIFGVLGGMAGSAILGSTHSGPQMGQMNNSEGFGQAPGMPGQQGDSDDSTADSLT